MRNFTYLAFAALLSAHSAAANAQASSPTFQTEKLSRGVIAVPPARGYGMYVSWRMFATDNDETTFDLLRDGEVVASDISNKTNFVDVNGFKSSQYQVVVKQMGVEVERSEPATVWDNIYYELQLDRPAEGNTHGSAYTYSPNDCSVGDVDGDGNYEIIVKWDPSNSQDNSKGGYTGNVILDCYKLDGTKLWRIDLGPNIRAGAHYTQFLVWDFDGDGKAELMCKTAPGSIDGKGNYVNQAATDPEIQSADNSKDWRNSGGRIDGGQEYLTVFNGETGAALHTVFYNPNRSAGYGGDGKGTFNWDDRSGKSDYASYGNRGERYLATVACLDGPDKPAGAVFSRGYYTYAFLWAVGFDGKEITTKWFHAARSKTKYSVTDAAGNTTEYTAPASTGNMGSNTAYGNGNHNLSCGDVDGDGYDEIIWGGCAIDHDGKLMYATGYGHGDAMHLSDLIPSRPGLEVFTVHEGSPYGWNIHDAATGEVLRYATGGGDNGRGLAADVSGSNPGFEFWSSNDGQVRSAENGSVVGDGAASTNFRAYWDGDLQDELFDGGKMEKWNSGRIYPVDGKNFYDFGSCCNGTKNTPNLLADIIGDWREEVIVHTDDKLIIFTTNVESNFRVPTLMHDHTYRLGVAWQNVAYNQPPHLGYYLPSIFTTRYGKITEGEFEQTVEVGQPIKEIKRRWLNSGAPTLLKSIDPDGNELDNMAMEGFTFYNDQYLTMTFSLTGTPTKEGDYKFIIASGANVIDGSMRNDTIVIHATKPSGISDANADGDKWASVESNVFADHIGINVNLTKPQNVSVKIFNTAGAVVFGNDYHVDGNANINVDGLGHLRSGIYIIRMEAADGRFVQKMIKR